MTTIAIFDSGVGGLTVYQEIVQQCPTHDCVFVSDNQAFPYGTKNAVELSERVIIAVAALVERYAPDLLVVACNTASTVMLPALRARYDFPIVGVVPAVKPAASLTQSNVIGLLATPATIKRTYTNELIGEFAKHCEIVRVGSSELVQMAEDKLRGKAVEIATLEIILEPFLNAKNLDTLVLACTHFPLLNNEIELVFKQKLDLGRQSIVIVDSGAAIAKRVASLLNGVPVERDRVDSYVQTSADTVGMSKSTAVFTQKIDDAKLIEHLSTQGFTKIQTLLVGS